jgi:hypothetical protein
MRRPVCFVLLGAIGCGGSGGHEPDAAAQPSPFAAREASGAADAGGAGGGGPDAGVADAGAAWTPFARRDDIPICLLARSEDWFEAQYLRDVKQKVSLKAGRPLYFGAYAPGCSDPECIRRVTLQCWADVEGKSITLSTRFSGERRLEHPCTDNCRPDAAACETPPLAAGTYVLKHGAQQRTIRIPSQVNPACLPAQ